MEELEASNRSLKEQVHRLEERTSKLQMVGAVGWGRVGGTQWGGAGWVGHSGVGQGGWDTVGVSHCFPYPQELEEERQRAAVAQRELQVSPATPVARDTQLTPD